MTREETNIRRRLPDFARDRKGNLICISRKKGIKAYRIYNIGSAEGEVDSVILLAYEGDHYNSIERREILHEEERVRVINRLFPAYFNEFQKYDTFLRGCEHGSK